MAKKVTKTKPIEEVKPEKEIKPEKEFTPEKESKPGKEVTQEKESKPEKEIKPDITEKALISNTNEPKILAFVCNWCGYGAVESAGVTKNEYPTNVEIVRVMCSGRVERKFIIDAIEHSVQGIIVVTCNFGNCHYMDGNVLAKQRIEATSKYLSELGYNKDRIKFTEIRASEGNKLAKILTDFVELIKNIK
jgi:coenzyme F420-reducing hydrogenase delta subunit